MISASLVKELRERTCAGMMECKKALEAANGDIEAAIDAMRKSGQAKAAKKASRIASEGIITVHSAADDKSAIMLEVNCETDFVAKDQNFLNFVNTVAAAGLTAKVTDVDSLLAMVLNNNLTVAAAREELIAKIGENIHVRRITFMDSPGIVGHYVHGNRIGVLVKLSVADKELGKDIAMHIAASKPMAINPEDLPQDLLAKEKEIFLAQVQSSGKPPAIMEKMINGRLQKFIEESALIKQAFVKDPNVTVGDLLNKANAKVLGFIRFEVGEGIEKKSTDFAAEVMAQI